MILSDRVHPVFRARPARGSLSLACARESDQREHTPDAALPAAVREVRPGFVERTSLMRATNSRASCARSCGHFRPALAAANGDPKITSRIKSKGKRGASASAFARRMRAALVFSGPHYIAAAAVGNARRGGARDRADFAACTGTCGQRSPTADADPERRMRAGRNVLGRVSLLTFSARAEKVRRSPEGRVEAFAPETKQTRTGFPPAQE